MNVGFVYDPIYLRHDTGQHVENARSLEAITSHLQPNGLKQQKKPIKPRPATVAELSLVHNEQHISHVQEVAQRGGGWLDGDTVMSPDSYDAALYAAGGTIAAVEAGLRREGNNPLSLC